MLCLGDGPIKTFVQLMSEKILPMFSSKSFCLYVLFCLLFRRHMEIPRIGVELELLLLAYTTAIAMPDPSYDCDAHGSPGSVMVFYGILWCFVLCVCLFCCCCLSRATPVAYGSSQATGWIEAAATSLHQSHSHARSKPCLWSTPQLRALLGVLWCFMEFYGVLSYVSIFFIVVLFLGPHQWCMEVPRLEVE